MHSVPALIRRCDDLPATITHVPVAAVLVLNTPDDGRSAEIKPAQCCIKLVFHLPYTMMRGYTKLKLVLSFVFVLYAVKTRALFEH